MGTHTSYQEAVYLALMEVPAGKVITYGNLARLAGRPGAARSVGTLMSGLSAHSKLPWHRVVNAQGRISLAKGSAAAQLQQQRLASEGVVFVGEKINLHQFGWPIVDDV